MHRMRHRGSSLLEVLIAIVVLSFGLLGLGGLAAAAQRYVKMAQFQSIGSMLAADLGERMRGNVAGFQGNGYVRTQVYSTDPVADAPTCHSAACSVDEMASADMAQWIGELRQRLPGGDAYVQRDTVNTLATDIWIMWIDPQLRLDPNASSLSVENDDDCPANALRGLASDKPSPRCMYYRISL